MAALALVVSGLLVVRSAQPEEPATPVATAGQDTPGLEFLFSRPLDGGGILQVLTTGVEGELLVRWPGSLEPTVLTPWYAGDDDLTSFVQGGTFPGSVRYGEMVLSEVDGQEWALISFMRCPDDTAPVDLRTWAEGASPDDGDAMVFLDDVAIVAVPFTRPFGDGPGVPVYFELRDAAGTVLFADGPQTSDHEGEERSSGAADPEPSSTDPADGSLPGAREGFESPGPVECGAGQ